MLVRMKLWTLGIRVQTILVSITLGKTLNRSANRLPLYWFRVPSGSAQEGVKYLGSVCFGSNSMKNNGSVPDRVPDTN